MEAFLKGTDYIYIIEAPGVEGIYIVVLILIVLSTIGIFIEGIVKPVVDQGIEVFRGTHPKEQVLVQGKGV